MALTSRICLWFVCLALAGCAAKPKKIDEVSYGNENSLTCRQLYAEMDKTLYYLRDADKYDRFQWKYMFPPTGAVSVYNIVSAKKKANQRKALLEDIMRRKQCYSGPRFSSFIEDGALSPTFNQAGLNRAEGSLARNYEVDFRLAKFERRGSDQTATIQGGFVAVAPGRVIADEIFETVGDEDDMAGETTLFAE